MSEVARGILNLAELTKVDPEQIQHFVASRTDAGDITLDVPRDRCVVITRIIQKNVDTTAANTIAIVNSGKNQDETREVDLVANEEVFYLYRSGTLVFTFVLTPEASKEAHIQMVGYELSSDALDVLARCATRLVPQS